MKIYSKFDIITIFNEIRIKKNYKKKPRFLLNINKYRPINYIYDKAFQS